MLSTKDAAAMLGVSQRRVQAMITQGLLAAEKIGGTWLVDEISVAQRMQGDFPAGRPRKGYRPTEERYDLMRRNEPVFGFACDRDSLAITEILDVHDPAIMPVGTFVTPEKPSISAFREWLSNRKIPDTRRNLAKYLQAGESGDTQHLMFKTLGLTLTDQYWLRPHASGKLDWNLINPFDNDYSHAKLNDPGNSTSGMLEKHWEKRNGVDVLVKRGFVQDREPYNEVLATKLLERMLPGEGSRGFVRYWLEQRDGLVFSVCESFVGPDVELASMADVMRSYSSRLAPSAYASYRDICEARGWTDVRAGLAKMIVFDFLTGNYDRHRLNLGILRDSRTGQWLRPAPLFDHGNAFFIHESRPDALMQSMYTYAAAPFSEYPTAQLALAEDFSWLDPAAFNGFGETIEAAYEGNDAVSAELAHAIAIQFGRRLARVLEVAAEHEPHFHALGF